MDEPNWTETRPGVWTREDGYRIERTEFEGEEWYRPKAPDGRAIGELCESPEEAQSLFLDLVPDG